MYTGGFCQAHPEVGAILAPDGHPDLRSPAPRPLQRRSGVAGLIRRRPVRD
ncbi:MAG TPA: hypothetical protein VGF11_07955 [Acidimicrobiales bacterium]